MGGGLKLGGRDERMDLVWFFLDSVTLVQRVKGGKA